MAYNWSKIKNDTENLIKHITLYGLWSFMIFGCSWNGNYDHFYKYISIPYFWLSSSILGLIVYFMCCYSSYRRYQNGNIIFRNYWYILICSAFGVQCLGIMIYLTIMGYQNDDVKLEFSFITFMSGNAILFPIESLVVIIHTIIQSFKDRYHIYEPIEV